MADISDELKAWIKDNPKCQDLDRPEHYQAKAVHALALACGVEVGSAKFINLLDTFVGKAWSKEDGERALQRALEAGKITKERAAKEAERITKEAQQLAAVRPSIELSGARSVDPGGERIH